MTRNAVTWEKRLCNKALSMLEQTKGSKQERKKDAMDRIEVSIICLTYNQEKYIRDTLDGFLIQQTNFNYEILVHDDVSTDGTVEILKEYQQKYPDKIRLILEEENQYSKGVDITKDICFPLVRGKYIAFCEGDDYWTKVSFRRSMILWRRIRRYLCAITMRWSMMKARIVLSLMC